MTKRGFLVWIGLLAAIIAIATIRTARVRRSNPHTLALAIVHPRGIMGTTCTLAAVTAPGVDGKAALADAEASLRRVEAHTSTWIEHSEISRLNAAAARDIVSLSDDSLTVLRAARRLYQVTDETFDITCRPLLELWRAAAVRQRPPTDAELRAARDRSRWEHIGLLNDVAVKSVDTACVDLGGIAKGYGIDCALEQLRQHGCHGGLVDVGGDLRCFGSQTTGQPWHVEVRDPFATDVICRLDLTDRAVCTSGNYARYVEVGGRRYSHIIDPRTGETADAAPSVTIIGPNAMETDAWATALSVLGRDGVRILPPDFDALLITGTADDWTMWATPRVNDWIVDRSGVPEQRLRTLRRQ